MATTLDQKWIAIALVVLSGALGLLVHPFYDWTGSNQSRPSPLLWRVPLIISLLCLSFCLALPWLQISRGGGTEKPFRFNLRELLLTAVAAVVLAVIVSRLPPFVSCLLLLVAAITIIMSAIRTQQNRMSVAAMFGVMYLPYLWLAFHFNFEVDFSEFLGVVLGLPGFLPSLLVSRTLGQHISEASWLPPLITSGMLVIGFVIVRLGPKVALAYFFLLLMVSLIGSLGLNAAMRI